MVFIDNLYMYGPQTSPLIETMPLTSYGAKPAARSAATRIWMEAAAAGRARVAALRPPDFYGPNVGLTFLGDTTIGAMARGKSAFFIGSPDIPHDYAYVPDIARAATTLLEAPDSAFGQSWHVPCAPTRTTREILKMAADALGVRLRLNTLPEGLLGAAGLFSPFLRELKEMRFTWDRPYRVDATKFAQGLLVGRDAVRNRRARNGAFVPAGGGQELRRCARLAIGKDCHFEYCESTDGRTPMPTRNVNLTAEQDAFVEDVVRAGKYQNASEAIRDALRGLQQRLQADDLKLELLRGQVKAGLEALERGAFTEVDGDALDETLDGLVANRR